MNYKKKKGEKSTVTRDMNTLSESVGNIYETVAILGKRANQIDQELKVELQQKLEDFSSAYSDGGIEEVFENREQIEVSRFYEKMPKATLLATQEFVEDKIYYKNPIKDNLRK
ncbi:MAG: RNA polymerase Rpb6 [Paludibacter sp.]|nr:MAG: RNA polymerase Rpb6 [Paludibacter sp.]